jgi:5-methylcytosine-specific restriction endonuclease McrA
MRSKRFCSGRCKTIAWVQRRRLQGLSTHPPARGLTAGKCERCGVGFVGNRNRRFCSDQCRELTNRPSRRAYDRARAKRYRDADPERAKRQRAEQRRKHANYWVEWRKNNREKTRAYSRKYREKNPARYRELLRAWAAANPDKRRASVRAWAKAHPDRHAFHSANRRARVLAAAGSHTYAEWQARLAEFANRCAYCGIRASLTRDHVIPLALGGSNAIDNIVPACRQCNARKRLMDAEAFLRMLRGEDSAA